MAEQEETGEDVVRGMGKPVIDIMQDDKIKDWLNSISNDNSRNQYMSSVKTFFTWLGQTPTEFIMAIDADSKKTITERRNIARAALVEFYRYATTEMPKRTPHRRVIGKGVSYNAAMTTIGAVRSFLNEFGITVKFEKRHRPVKEGTDPYKRLRLNVAQVRSLLSNARSPRDRAIIITLAQSGMDTSTLVSLKYRDIKGAVAEGAEMPYQLDLFRHKAGMEYYSFMGAEGVESLKLYLADLEHRGIKLKDDDPLLVADKGRLEEIEEGDVSTNKKVSVLVPLHEHNIQKMLKVCAIKAALINGEDRYNVAGGHALREFFSSALNEAKVPKTYIDEMLGHTPSGMDNAYFKDNPDAIKAEYARAYDRLSLMPQGQNGGAVITALKAEFGDSVERLIAKNADLENRLTTLINNVESLKTENIEIKKKLDLVEAFLKGEGKVYDEKIVKR